MSLAILLILSLSSVLILFILWKIWKLLNIFRETILEKIKANEQGLTSHCGHIEMKLAQILMLMNSRDPHLSLTNSYWILEKDDVSKFFKPGHIEKVVNTKDDSEFKYEYSESGMTCSGFINGKLMTKIEFSNYGVPMRGSRYGDNGEIIEQIIYDSLGQVEKTGE